MMRSCARLVLLLSTLAATACAGAAPSAGPPGAATLPDAGAVGLQRDWWRAFATGDTAYLQAHTAPEFRITLSSGETHDRAGMLAQAATHADGGRLTFAWADEAVRRFPPRAAIVTSRVTETLGSTSTVYRWLTVLEQGDAGWRVAGAQSTREAAFTPRVSAAVAGALGDYAGEYRTPRGAVLRVVVRDSALALVEPSGQELPMEPIGPALFEFRALSLANGVVRFAFTRDASGLVIALNRLISGEVTTFPRIP